MTAVSVAEQADEVGRGLVDVIEAELDHFSLLRLLSVDSPTQIHGGERRTALLHLKQSPMGVVGW